LVGQRHSTINSLMARLDHARQAPGPQLVRNGILEAARVVNGPVKEEFLGATGDDGFPTTTRANDVGSGTGAKDTGARRG
jgi:hypothetical protein